MYIECSAAQDRRNTSRVFALLDCSLRYGDSLYEALVVDLSPKGALISSTVLPPHKSEVSISLNSGHLKQTLILTGSVIRSTELFTAYGKRIRFVVRFHYAPPDLFFLLGKLHAAWDRP